MLSGGKPLFVYYFQIWSGLPLEFNLSMRRLILSELRVDEGLALWKGFREKEMAPRVIIWVEFGLDGNPRTFLSNHYIVSNYLSSPFFPVDALCHEVHQLHQLVYVSHPLVHHLCLRFPFPYLQHS